MDLKSIREKYMKPFYIKETNLDDLGIKIPGNKKRFIEILLTSFNKEKDGSFIGYSSLDGEKIVLIDTSNIIRNEEDLDKFVNSKKKELDILEDEEQKNIYLNSLDSVSHNIKRHFRTFGEEYYNKIFIKKGLVKQEEWIEGEGDGYIFKITEINKLLSQYNIGISFLDNLKKQTAMDLFFTDARLSDIDKMLDTILFKIKQGDIDFLIKIKDISEYIVALNSIFKVELSLEGCIFKVKSKYEMEIADFLVNEIGFSKKEGLSKEDIMLSDRVLITENDFTIFMKKLCNLDNGKYALEKQQLFIEADCWFHNKIQFNIKREYRILEGANPSELLEMITKRNQDFISKYGENVINKNISNILKDLEEKFSGYKITEISNSEIIRKDKYQFDKFIVYMTNLSPVDFDRDVVISFIRNNVLEDHKREIPFLETLSLDFEKNKDYIISIIKKTI